MWKLSRLLSRGGPNLRLGNACDVQLFPWDSKARRPSKGGSVKVEYSPHLTFITLYGPLYAHLHIC